MTRRQWSDDRPEDWTHGAQWDVTLPSGDPVDSLDDLARILGKTRLETARALLRMPSGAVAPAALQKEVRDVLSGQAATGKPQQRTFDVEGLPGLLESSAPARDAPEHTAEVKRGHAVTWAGGSGHVDMIVARGLVPGVDLMAYGSHDDPALRVVLADGTKTVVRASAATVLSDRPEPSGGLVALVAAQQAAEHDGTPAYARVTGSAVKAAWARGRASWPGNSVTTMDRDDWALGRVKAYLALLTGGPVPAGYTRDHDLLPTGHPARLAAVEEARAARGL